MSSKIPYVLIFFKTYFAFKEREKKKLNSSKDNIFTCPLKPKSKKRKKEKKKKKKAISNLTAH